MNESSESLHEIRRIRDENSKRHLEMTSEEIKNEFDVSTQRFISLLGKDIQIISSPNN